jgi:RNA polymerase sigma-32 factor
MAKIVKDKKSLDAKPSKKKKSKGSLASSSTRHRQVTAEVLDPADEANQSLDFPDSIGPDSDLHESGSQDLTLDEPLIAAPEKLDVKSLTPISERGLTTTDPLITYLNEIRKYSLLTREQEQEVAKRYFETKDPAAAQELIKANLRFVVKVAAEYSRFGAKMIDLIQEGNVGLMHAVKEYNPYKGVRLITYAVWWIRGYIQEYLMKQFSMVKIGTTPNQRKLFYQLQKQKEELEKLGPVGVEAISTKLGIPIEEVESMHNRLTQRDVSLDKPLNDDGSVTLQDLQRGREELPMDEQLAQAEMIELLKKKIEEIRPQLSERENIILQERLLNEEPLTLQEIGEKYGITREAVRQAEVRLMRKIKDRMGLKE